MDEQKNTEKKDVDFVRIEITERQFVTKKKDSDDPLYVSKNGVEFGKVICPEGGTFWYPVKNMFVYDNKTVQTHDGQTLRLFHFDQPSGTEMEIHYSNGVGEADTVKTVTIDDLKEIFQQAKINYAQEHSTFVNFEVPSSWDRTPNDEYYARISVPISVDGEKKYYTFLLDRNKNWNESTKHEGYSYFGFPRVNNNTGEPWLITLRGDEKQEDGFFTHPEIKVTSADLKTYVDEAVSACVKSHLSDSHSLASEKSDAAEEKKEAVPAQETAAASEADEETFRSRAHGR